MERIGTTTSTTSVDDVLRADTALATTLDCSVLITGDVTRAELIARSIHGGGERRAEPFVVARCRKERDLKSAASLARRGTLFLDGADSLDPVAQHELVILLRSNAVFRTGPRIIAADTGGLFGLVVAGSFDSHLFYQLNVIHIRLTEDEEQRLEQTQPVARYRPVLDVPDTLIARPFDTVSRTPGAQLFFSVDSGSVPDESLVPWSRSVSSSRRRRRGGLAEVMSQLSDVLRAAGQNIGIACASLWNAAFPHRRTKAPAN